MKIKGLRKFLFLDTDTVSEWLASLEGAVLSGIIQETEQESEKKGAGADAKFLKGDLAQEDSRETRREQTITPAAQFQHLYSLLKDQDGIQFLESFDEGIWSQLERDEILEIEARIRLPQILAIAKAMQSISPLVNAIAPMKDLLDINQQDFDQVHSQVNAMSGIGSLANEEKVPILFEATGTPQFRFLAHLPQKYLRSNDLLDLEGEAVVFGKIQRFIRKGQTETVSITHGIDALNVQLNRRQRRAKEKKASHSDQNLIESVKGPGVILMPVAIYR